MGIVKGLDSINKHVDATEAKYNGGGSDAPKTKWFKLDDKQAVKVVFLQELDPDSENYSQKNDLGFIAVEHSNPKDFKRKALCSIDDEGACWACEQHKKDWKAGWKQKSRLYINVLIDDGKNEPYVAVLSQGMSEKQITPALIEFAGELGTITDKWFKIKRSGAGFNDTSYLLTPLGAHDKDVESFELYDLEKVVRSVPYAQQEAHYLDGVQADAAPASEPALVGASSATSSAEEW